MPNLFISTPYVTCTFCACSSCSRIKLEIWMWKEWCKRAPPKHNRCHKGSFTSSTNIFKKHQIQSIGTLRSDSKQHFRGLHSHFQVANLCLVQEDIPEGQVKSNLSTIDTQSEVAYRLAVALELNLFTPSSSSKSFLLHYTSSCRPSKHCISLRVLYETKALLCIKRPQMQ